MEQPLVKGWGLQARYSCVLLGVLVFLAAAAIALPGGDQLRFPDEGDYHRLAQSINAGDGYVDTEGSPTAYRAPGYPYLLSLLYRVWPRPLAGKLANAFAYGATAWLLSILVARVAPLGRLVAPLLVLFYPLGLYTASTLYPQTVGGLMLVALVLLLSTRPARLLITGSAGVLLGALVLTIPSFLLLVPLFAVFIAVAMGAQPHRAMRHTALLLAGVALAVAPWMLRNATLFDAVVPISTNSGENLLLGNSENARPNSGVNVDISRYVSATEGLGEAAADAALRRYALRWINENPARAATLYGQKTLNYFNYRNDLATQSEGSSLRDLIAFVSYYPLLLLALIRLLLVRRYPLVPIESMLYALYGSSALLTAIFFTRIRFRIPFDMLLIAIAAGTISLLVTMRLDHRATASGEGQPSGLHS